MCCFKSSIFIPRNYTDPPATKVVNPVTDGDSSKGKPTKIIINRENNSSHIDTTKSVQSKLGLTSKIVPVTSKSPINKTNMATGKPITPVKAATTSRVIKSAGNNTQNTKSKSEMIRSNSASCERNDNRKNETIEKRKKEEKLRLKLEKEAKKVIQ